MMHTLLILIPSSVDWTVFDQGWPDFLHQAERMPGLIREEVLQVEKSLTGHNLFSRMYSFHFEDQASLIEAMTSPPGKQASQMIHRITGGKAVILTGETKEDQPDSWSGSPSENSSR